MRFREIAISSMLCVMISGCSSTSSIESHQQISKAPEDELVEINRKIECLKRYSIALQECQEFLGQERNLAIKDRQMIKCMSIKGFPNGADNCK